MYVCIIYVFILIKKGVNTQYVNSLQMWKFQLIILLKSNELNGIVTGDEKLSEIL